MNRHLKSVKILEELLAYFFRWGIQDLNIQFSSHATDLEITISGKTDKVPDDLDYLVSMLNKPRQLEFEEYYWNLLGEGAGRNEQHLLGSLVDSGSAAFEDGYLTVQLRRVN